MHSLLSDIGFTVIAAAILGVASYFLRQPILLALVAAGVIIGPKLGLGFVHSGESIEVISELGLVLLLFLVGLETNLKELQKSGKGLLLTGLGQFPICVAIGMLLFPLCSAIGILESQTILENAYLAILCALSSTAIVVKLLYEKKDLSTLPGRLTLGVLVCQDLYAIFVLALQPNLNHPQILPVALAIASTIGLVIAAFAASKYVLERLYRGVSMSPEIVIFISLGWCAICAGVAQKLGLSKEMGALIAGISISAFPYSTHVAARVLPLRDFFLTLFFVALGMKIDAPTVSMIVPILVISFVLVASRFLSVYPLAIASKTGSRAAFNTSINLAQMSEFSLVIASLGVQAGHISQSMMSIVVYTMVFLAIISSHAIKESDSAYKWLRRILGKELKDAHRVTAHHGMGHGKELVFLGFHRGARAFLNAVGERRPELLERVLVVDFNPRRVDELKRDGIDAVFGDISNFEILRHIGLQDSRIIVSIVPDMLLRGTNNISIVRMARALAPHAIVAATADGDAHQEELVHEGAQIILRPFDLAGKEMIDSLTNLLNSHVGKQIPSVTETLAHRWSWNEQQQLKDSASNGD